MYTANIVDTGLFRAIGKPRKQAKADSNNDGPTRFAHARSLIRLGCILVCGIWVLNEFVETCVYFFDKPCHNKISEPL